MNAVSHTGRRLRLVRELLGMSLGEVEQRSAGEWKAVVIGSYERGQRNASVERLARYAGFLRVPLIAFFPSPEGDEALMGLAEMLAHTECEKFLREARDLVADGVWLDGAA